MNSESFPNVQLSNGTFHADQANTTKVFPTFGWNPVKHKTLTFAVYGTF